MGNGSAAVRFNVCQCLALSGSCSDDLFRVLMLEVRLERVVEQVVLVDAADPVARVIAEVIARRR